VVLMRYIRSVDSFAELVDNREISIGMVPSECAFPRLVRCARET
jgi:hypothetical protein